MLMNKQKLAFACTIVVLVFVQLSSCVQAQPVAESSNEWEMFRLNPAHTAFTSMNQTLDGAELLWRFPTNRAVHSSPAVSGDLLFIGSRDHYVYCFNASSGLPVWAHKLGWEVWPSPAIDKHQVYVGADDGYVYALNITSGETVWRTSIGEAPVRSSPTLVDGKIYIGSGAGGLYCLNASTGGVVWVASTWQQVWSTPAVSDGAVFFACDDYDVHAVNASTDQEIWRAHAGCMQSSPSVSGGKVYVGSVDGYVVCLNASDGGRVWQFQTDDQCQVESSPAVAYGYVYVGSHSGYLYCLNMETGSLVWKARTGYWIISSPAVYGGNVYVGSEDHCIYCFDAQTGVQKWRYETGSLIESSPTIVNGKLFVGSDDFNIYAFALTNSSTALPQDNNGLNWNTAVFNILATTIIAGSIAVLGFFSYKDRQKKVNQPGLSRCSLLKGHIDFICVLSLLAFSSIFLLSLGNGGLWISDEQTYSQWAFHMTKTGDYLTPWCFGETNFWIAKPPLYMWLMALSYEMFGFSNFATRLVSPIFGALTLILVYFLGKKLFSWKVGFGASLILATFTTFFSFSRHAMTDIASVFFMTAGIYFILGNETGKRSNGYAALSGAFFGLALLTKQVQALLLPLIIIVYYFASRKGREIFSRRFLLFLSVGLLIFLPWLIYMLTQFGQIFSEWYFVYSGVVRAMNPLEGHSGDSLFYFNYLATKEGPIWVALLPFGIGLSAYYAAAKQSKPDILLLVWIFAVLGLFSFAQTKLYWYILPAFPAFSLTISNFIVKLAERFTKKRKRRDPKFFGQQ